jgi:hypothetical protein
MKYWITFLGVLSIMIMIVGSVSIFALPIWLSVALGSDWWFMMYFVVVPGLFAIGQLFRDWVNK